jgi:hypothetical protein
MEEPYTLTSLIMTECKEECKKPKEEENKT